jgi:hypothetical protein
LDAWPQEDDQVWPLPDRAKPSAPQPRDLPAPRVTRGVVRLAPATSRAVAAGVVGIASVGLATTAPAQVTRPAVVAVGRAEANPSVPGLEAKKRVLDPPSPTGAGEKDGETNDSTGSRPPVDPLLDGSSVVFADDQNRLDLRELLMEEVLLIDSLGRLVIVPAAELSRALLPPADIGLRRQIPERTAKGAKVPREILQRMEEAREDRFRLFPAVPPRLMPYLATQDEFGNTAIRPGALISSSVFDAVAQQAKYRLSEYGLRYSLQQTSTFADMTEVVSGDDTLGFYTFDLQPSGLCFTRPAPAPPAG